MTQLFRTTEVLHLEVENAWPAAPNLVTNHSGEFGAWGWVNTSAVPTGLRATLEAGTLPGTEFAVSDPLPISERTLIGLPGAGHIRVVVEVVSLEGTSNPGVRLELDFYDDAGTLLTGPDYEHFTAERASPGFLNIDTDNIAPSGAASFVIKVGVGVSDVAPVTYDHDLSVTFRGVAATSTVTNAMPDVEPLYVDLIATATSIATDRGPMDVATLNTTLVRDPFAPIRLRPGGPLLHIPDPDQPGLVRKGKRIRLRTKVTDPATGDLETVYLFRGTISDHETTYDVTSRPGYSVPKVQLAAVDPYTTLAGTTRPNGAPELRNLIPLVLTGTGVPYDVDGITSYAGRAEWLSAPPVTVQADANAADQIVITRDTNLAYAWLDARGVLVARSNNNMPEESSGTFDEEFYNAAGPAVGYNLTELINSLTIRLRYIDPASPGETQEVTAGPFEDLDSIREYGGRMPKEVVIAGDPEQWLPGTPDGKLEPYAAAVLAANSSTRRRITSVTAAVTTNADLLPGGTAHHDLYELVVASCARAGIVDQDSRITRVSHSIVPGKWLVTYGLADLGRVATHRRIRVLRQPTLG